MSGRRRGMLLLHWVGRLRRLQRMLRSKRPRRIYIFGFVFIIPFFFFGLVTHCYSFAEPTAMSNLSDYPTHSILVRGVSSKVLQVLAAIVKIKGILELNLNQWRRRTPKVDFPQSLQFVARSRTLCWFDLGKLSSSFIGLEI